jgi:hypothetical protein
LTRAARGQSIGGGGILNSGRRSSSVQRLLDRGACKMELPLDMESPLTMDTPKRFGVEMARVLAVTIRTGVRENWQELRAIEEQIESITEEYDGEDVLHARVRGNLDEAKALLIDLHKELQEYTEPFDLPDTDEETRASVQRIVDNDVNHVPTR